MQQRCVTLTTLQPFFITWDIASMVGHPLFLGRLSQPWASLGHSGHQTLLTRSLPRTKPGCTSSLCLIAGPLTIRGVIFLVRVYGENSTAKRSSIFIAMYNCLPHVQTNSYFLNFQL